MMIFRLFPPIALLSALAGAGLTAFWLLQPDSFPSFGTSSATKLGTLTPDSSEYYRLPEPFNSEEPIRQFTTRPLFAEGRRSFVPIPAEQPDEVEPLPEPPAPAVEETLTPLEIRLLGIMENDGGRRALVAEEGNGEQHWLAVGEEVQGWILVAVDDSRIRLKVDDVEITFNLFEETIP